MTGGVSSIQMKGMSSVDLQQVAEDQAQFLRERDFSLALETHFFGLSVFPGYKQKGQSCPSSLAHEYWPKGASPKKLWDQKEGGEDTRLLVHCQGAPGDVVAASRFLFSLKEKGLERVLFLPPKETIPFFKEIFEGDDLIEVVEQGEKREFDAHIPLFSLPILLDIDLSTSPKLPFLGRKESEQFECGVLCSERVKVGLVGGGFPKEWMDRVNTTFYQLSLGNGVGITWRAEDMTQRIGENPSCMLNMVGECDEFYVDSSYWGCVIGAMGKPARIVRSVDAPDSLSPAYRQNAVLYPTIEQVDLA